VPEGGVSGSGEVGKGWWEALVPMEFQGEGRAER
jgi:hypothetical protein